MAMSPSAKTSSTRHFPKPVEVPVMRKARGMFLAWEGIVKSIGSKIGLIQMCLWKTEGGLLLDVWRRHLTEIQKVSAECHGHNQMRWSTKMRFRIGLRQRSTMIGVGRQFLGRWSIVTFRSSDLSVPSRSVTAVFCSQPFCPSASSRTRHALPIRHCRPRSLRIESLKYAFLLCSLHLLKICPS